MRTTEFPEMALTGVGLVSPIGSAKSEFFKFLKKSALPDPSEGSSESPEPGQLLTRLNITEPKLKIARYLDPVSKNAIVAMRGTLTDAGLEENQIANDPFEFGIVLGTTRGPTLTREGVFRSFTARQGKAVSGTLFSHCGYNIAGAMTAIAYGIKGPNLTVADRWDLGLCVLRRARQILLSRRAHTVFAGFTECTGISDAGGASFGEFAYLLCLERRERAVERGVPVLAEVSVEDEDPIASQAERRIVPRAGAKHSPRIESIEALSRSLPGLQAFGRPFWSLFLTGLLAHEPGFGTPSPTTGFSAGGSGLRATIKLFHAEVENLAV